jgi:hypothetical protein
VVEHHLAKVRVARSNRVTRLTEGRKNFHILAVSSFKFNLNYFQAIAASAQSILFLKSLLQSRLDRVEVIRLEK